MSVFAVVVDAEAACGGARVLGRFRGGDLSSVSAIGLGGLGGRPEDVSVDVGSVMAWSNVPKVASWVLSFAAGVSQPPALPTPPKQPGLVPD